MPSMKLKTPSAEYSADGVGLSVKLARTRQALEVAELVFVVNVNQVFEQ